MSSTFASDLNPELDLSPHSAALLGRVREVARSCANRADLYDHSAKFPVEDFEELYSAGLNAPTVPVEYGGLGVGPVHRDALTLWLMTKEFAKADLSLGRCWESHVNSLLLIDAMGTPEQKARWFAGVVNDGDIWSVWSSEPQKAKPGEQQRFGTTLTRADGGWEVTGSKAFATNAGGAHWAILLCNPTGPGGARESAGAADSLLMLACPLSSPKVTVDDSWWDPVGMRATASHLVRFDHAFVPDENVIGPPGGYFGQVWHTGFAAQYAASFLGAAEAAYDYAVGYVTKQGKDGDPYVQQRVGAMTVDVGSGQLWLRHVARLWDTSEYELARLAGRRARHVAEHLALRTVDNCIRACGARSLVRPSPVERILRDLTFYVRHDNDDHVLAEIGRALIGQLA